MGWGYKHATAELICGSTTSGFRAWSPENVYVFVTQQCR